MLGLQVEAPPPFQPGTGILALEPVLKALGLWGLRYMTGERVPGTLARLRLRVVHH